MLIKTVFFVLFSSQSVHRSSANTEVIKLTANYTRISALSAIVGVFPTLRFLNVETSKCNRQQSSGFTFIWVHNPTVVLANTDSISLVLLYIQLNYRLFVCTGNSECTQNKWQQWQLMSLMTRLLSHPRISLLSFCTLLHGSSEFGLFNTPKMLSILNVGDSTRLSHLSMKIW